MPVSLSRQKRIPAFSCRAVWNKVADLRTPCGSVPHVFPIEFLSWCGAVFYIRSDLGSKGQNGYLHGVSFNPREREAPVRHLLKILLITISLVVPLSTIAQTASAAA